jgi:phosphatidylserine/phosphatidylglycerophosphate/cardiolipin synthase-like enzyme
MARKGIIVSLFFLLFPPLYGETKVFFSPDDKVTTHLVSSIKNARTKIYGAIYLITDKKIADALIEAKNNNHVDIQIITDQTSLDQNSNKVQYLKQNGVDTFVFKTGQNKNKYFAPLMHNKFAIIDNKVWTGSFNWTVSANIKNKENVTVLDDEATYKKYCDQFEKLKRQCVYHPTVATEVARRKKKAWYKKAVKNVDRFLTIIKRKLGHSNKKS